MLLMYFVLRGIDVLIGVLVGNLLFLLFENVLVIVVWFEFSSVVVFVSFDLIM